MFVGGWRESGALTAYIMYGEHTLVHYPTLTYSKCMYGYRTYLVHHALAPVVLSAVTLTQIFVEDDELAFAT